MVKMVVHGSPVTIKEGRITSPDKALLPVLKTYRDPEGYYPDLDRAIAFNILEDWPGEILEQDIPEYDPDVVY